MSQQIKFNMISQTPQNKEFQGEMHQASQTFYKGQPVPHFPLISCFCYVLFCVHFSVFFGRHKILNFLQFKKKQKFKFFSNLKRKRKGPLE